MMTGSVGGLLLGVLLGARHALEPDHLAAVSVLSTERPNGRGGALLGTFWGAGHTAALLGTALALALLRTEMPRSLADGFELAVAVMLVVLGLRAIPRALREGRNGPETVHSHGTHVHHHAGHASHVHVGPWALARRPFIVGVVHGLAGSGALTALVVASLPSWASRFLFMALFGLGSVAGMAALSGAAGWPLAQLSRRPAVAMAISALVGAASTILGVAWGWPLVARFAGAMP
jgi:hypothetical protein